MGRCLYCGRRDSLVAEVLGACADCIRSRPEALAHVWERRAQARREFGLPIAPPRTEGGVACRICANECRMGEGERGFCGLRTAHGGRLVHLAGTSGAGLLQSYHDPLPTNCVADPVCAGHSARGRTNLAVFYGACSFDCLYCQNWHFRQMSPSGRLTSAQELADRAGTRAACVCYFGGDPAPQMPHALATSRILAGRGLHICWETNGSMNPRLLRQAVQLSLATGGTVKFDLKAWNPALHLALTGADNRRTLDNFAQAAERSRSRPEPPLVVASTLLVPGYVDAQEVRAIARFIAAIDRNIPYVLLAFAPAFLMHDLPCTSSAHAREALEAAQAEGLTRVRIGNPHLLDLGWV
ncbi:MAG: radical SAM protein [Chloroflexi bacterium]|nr:radical SAM protein [Chloroflexota bacterium]